MTADVRLNLEKRHCSLPCIETNDSRGEPQAFVSSVDAREEPSHAQHAGACGKGERQHMDHIAEKGHVGSFQNGLVHEPVSHQEAMKIPEANAAVDKQWDKLILKNPA